MGGETGYKEEQTRGSDRRQKVAEGVQASYPSKSEAGDQGRDGVKPGMPVFSYSVYI